METTTTKPQDHKPFKFYNTDLNFEAWTEQQLTQPPVFIKPNPYVLKLCEPTRPAVKLLHRLKHVYSVVVDDLKAETNVVVEEKESLVGIKYVADCKPTSILSALIELQLVDHDATHNYKWTDLLEDVMSLIHRVLADYDNSGSDDTLGDLGRRCQQLVVVDIVSSMKYCCFEQVADNEDVLMST